MSFLDKLRESMRYGFAPSDERVQAAAVISPVEEELLVELRGPDGTANVGAPAIRLYLLFSGEVQGVGFRWNNQGLARDRGLVGWVRNLDDGTVEMEIQGPPQALAVHLCNLHTYYKRFANKIWLERFEYREVNPDDTDFNVRMS